MTLRTFAHLPRQGMTVAAAHAGIRSVIASTLVFALLGDFASAQPLPQTGEPQTVLAQVAQTVGIRRCYAAVSAVSSRMYTNTRRADVVLDWDKENPDGAPFFSVSGLDYGESAALLSLTTVPAPVSGCTVMAERISSAPVACREVARSELQGYQANVLVKSVTVYTMPARARETVTLVDAPPSCLILRRQVQYARSGER